MDSYGEPAALKSLNVSGLSKLALLYVGGTAVFVLGGVDLLDPLAELHDVIPERFQQHVERFAVGLLESARLFAQNVIGEVLELGPKSFLHFFIFLRFGRSGYPPRSLRRRRCAPALRPARAWRPRRCRARVCARLLRSIPSFEGEGNRGEVLIANRAAMKALHYDNLSEAYETQRSGL